MRHGWLLWGLIAGCTSDGAPRAAPQISAQDSPSTTALPPDSSSGAWQISPSAASAFTRQTSEAELRRRYGPDSVRGVRIELGEGETAPGTVVYPADSLRRVEIMWRDTLKRQTPARVILRGDESKWQVGRGISLGTSLEDLERLNGRPFTLAGFGWDYAGAVTNWNGGALQSVLAGVMLYLDPGPAQYESAPYSQVLGDRDYSSALPAMQQLNPRVAQIFVDFE
jgi:hypothetical protein